MGSGRRQEVIIQPAAQFASVVPVVSDATPCSRKPGRHGALGESLQIERDVELQRAESVTQVENGARRFEPLPWNHDEFIESFVIAQQLPGGSLDDPCDIRPRQGIAQRIQHGQSMHHVADGAQPNDENPFLQPSVILLVVTRVC